MFPVSPPVTLRRFALGLVAVAATGCALVLSSAASAQSPTTLMFKELIKGSTFAFVDSAPMSTAKGEPTASLGDRIVFTNPLVNTAGKRVGRLYSHCTAVVAARKADNAAFACEAVVVLGSGTMTGTTVSVRLPLAAV